MRMGDTLGEKIDGARGSRPGSAQRQPSNNAPRKEITATAAPVNNAMASLFANAKQLKNADEHSGRVSSRARFSSCWAAACTAWKPGWRKSPWRWNRNCAIAAANCTAARCSVWSTSPWAACSSTHGFDQQSATIECKIDYIRAVSDEVRSCARRG